MSDIIRGCTFFSVTSFIYFKPIDYWD